MILDGQVRLLYEKLRHDTEWRHNLSLGARAAIHSPEDFPEVVSLAQKAGAAIGLRVCAIDIIKSPRGLEILEVNSGLMFESLLRQLPDMTDSVALIYHDILMRTLQ